MSTQTPKKAIEPQLITSTTGQTFYTVPEGPGSTAAKPVLLWFRLDKLTLLNIDGAVDYTATLWLVPKSGTKGTDNVQLNALILPFVATEPTQPVALIGKLLKSGDSIQAKASSASKIQIACEGREIS